MNPMVRPDDGLYYCSYFLCYLDEIFCVSPVTGSVTDWLDKYLKFNNGWVGELYIHLGLKIKNKRL